MYVDEGMNESYNQGKFKGYNQLQDIRDQLQFSLGMAQHGKNLISIFQEVFPKISKIFILAGGLRTRVSFFVGQTLS